MASVIVGIGSEGSETAVSLIKEILRRSSRHELVAVGVFNDEPGRDEDRPKFGRQAQRAKVSDISIPPNRPNGVVDILKQVHRFAPLFALLIIDADLLLKHRDAIENLRERTPRMEALCLMCIAGSQAEQAAAVAALKQLTERNDALLDAPIVTYAIVARNGSPLFKTHHAHGLMARSLAAVWSAPRRGHYRDTFKSFTEHLGAMRNEDHRILGLTVGSIGMPRTANPFARLFYRVAPWAISMERAQARIVELTKDLLHNRPQPMTTLDRMPEPDRSNPKQIREMDITINFTVPFAPGNVGAGKDRYSDILRQVEQGLRPANPSEAEAGPAQQDPRSSRRPSFSEEDVPDATKDDMTGDDMRGYAVRLTSLARSRGVNLSKSRAADFKAWKGAAYGQVCVFYPIEGPNQPAKE